MRLREHGAAYAYSKSDGNAYIFQRSEFPRLKADWMAGKAFFEGVGFYGAVIDETPESNAVNRADKAAGKQEDAIE